MMNNIITLTDLHFLITIFIFLVGVFILCLKKCIDKRKAIKESDKTEEKN